MAVKAVVILAQWEETTHSAALDDLVARGSSGRLVWRLQSTLEQDLLRNCPVAYSAHTEDFLTAADTASQPLLVLKCGMSSLDSLIPAHRDSKRLSVILHSLPFPQRAATPFSHLIPRQSYQFSNGLDISELVDTSVCAFFVEYEKDYTRRDWLQTTQQAKDEVGGCGIILAEHYLKEVGYRLGKCKKYGA